MEFMGRSGKALLSRPPAAGRSMKGDGMGRGGYSLIELLIALALTLLVTASLVQLFLSHHHRYAVLEAEVEMWQSLSAGLDFVEREIRLAGYGLSPGTPPLIQMDPQIVRFQLDRDRNGPPFNAVSYRFQRDRSQLQRRVDSGPWAPLVEQVSDLAFTYQDGTDAVTEDPREVRRVGVALTVRAFRPDPAWPENGGYRTRTLERALSLRNVSP